MTGSDPARATADAIADRLTSTILARYQGDPVTKQADPNGRRPMTAPPATLDEVQPPLYVQAMLETATAEGRAEALAEQLSDLSLDRMALVDRLVDREREAASVIVDLHVANARAVDEANNARALLASATARADQLEAELDSDPRRAVLQTIWDTATAAITAIGGRNLDGIDTAGRVELLAERAMEMDAENRHDVDSDTNELQDAVDLIEGVRELAVDTLIDHHRALHGDDSPPPAVPEDVDGLVRALRSTLERTRERLWQLSKANVDLQRAVNGRHSVVDGEVREHTEQAPTGGVEVTPSPASPCSNCGHTRAAHDPGAEWNADQAGIHRTCKPPCPCTVYVPVAPKPS
ncbi:hypothetical protein SEA_PARIES_72 [Gordonia phage Paries]|uniref:Uncharacterized protein n=1 Tax=Gordonia phage Paries TaxID=2762413 RepID=A0A7G8LE03_9CAUD|nr:hypothetical protein KNV17_gp72 [Gordonia phage Paries]QNJ55475.1 hypothetical protein SEA_PARIES_72 [Gordonia phage Paries]